MNDYINSSEFYLKQIYQRFSIQHLRMKLLDRSIYKYTANTDWLLDLKTTNVNRNKTLVSAYIHCLNFQN